MRLKRGLRLDKFKIKLSDSLKNIPLNTEGSEIVDNGYDLLISDDIPDKGGLFIVVWDKHDVKKIENKILTIKGDRHKNLRGFFLKREVKKNHVPLINTIKEIKEEIKNKDDFKKEADKIKNRKSYIEIGSLVTITDGDKLDNIYSQPRFTSLFIDKPMLQLMNQLSRILEEMKPAIEKLEKDYKKVMGKSCLNKKKEFDPAFIEELQKLKKTNPVRIESILLTGDTGVGKTLIARWIHENRFPGSFQEVNAAGLSLTLLESEMFGHVKGAFTDAKQDKSGKSLLSLGGVLFLDEVGDIPLEIQPRVMKFIEEKTFVPEGWDKMEPIYAPSLVVAATNKDLEKEVKEGRFRRDFYARFHHRVHIPSIEERKDSLPVIVDFILQNPAVNKNKTLKYISNDTIDKLKGLKYEENFRGLERVVKDAAYKTIEAGLDIILPEVISS